MEAETNLTSSQEDYLKAIFHLVKDNKVARVRDIAKRMQVKMPTVTSALKQLSSKDYVNYDPHQFITLTEKGELLAGEIVRRHEVLVEFLKKILNVAPVKAETNACRLEHVFDEEVMEQFVNFLEFIENCPRGGSDMIEGFRDFCSTTKDEESCVDCCKRALILAEKRVQEFSDIEMISLADLPLGARARIEKIKGNGEIKRRLMEMGITRGTFLKMEHIAPLGDPIGIKIKGYHLSLRKEEASQILVKRLPKSGGYIT